MEVGVNMHPQNVYWDPNVCQVCEIPKDRAFIRKSNYIFSCIFNINSLLVHSFLNISIECILCLRH